jgi:hypothetical protein
MEDTATTGKARAPLKAASALVVGLVLSAAAAFADLLLFWILLWSCSGSDVSSPPPQGSSGDAVCTGLELGPEWSAFGVTVSAAAWIVFVSCAAVSIAGPLIGGALAAKRNRWRPLAGGTVIGAGAVLVFAVLLWIVDPTAQPFVFLFPPVAAFGLALLFFARSQGNGTKRV